MDYTGLLFDCPIKEQLENCAFVKLRKLELKERFEAWKQLSKNEREQLINRHHICIYDREQVKYKIENFTLQEKGY